MKDLGKPKCHSLLQIEHLLSYIMVYYVVYIQNILEKFIVDKYYPSITLMVVHVGNRSIILKFSYAHQDAFM